MRLRIGIDVGGTFTHAVAINNDTLEVVAHAVTPTTHASKTGVAEGIVGVFHQLRELLPSEHKIVFLAHSTTQATNALLEGFGREAAWIDGAIIEGLKDELSI